MCKKFVLVFFTVINFLKEVFLKHFGDLSFGSWAKSQRRFRYELAVGICFLRGWNNRLDGRNMRKCILFSSSIILNCNFISSGVFGYRNVLCI